MLRSVRYVSFILLVIVLLQTFSACHRYEYSPQLVEADRLCDVQPESAVKMLRLMSKDTSGMDDDNLHYYYLLTLKAADKSYVTHTSDSLARRIVSYYEDGGDERLLPEVYYYAGRVHRDIGDAPQALDYFQKALDLMENDTTNLKLKSVIYSQMGYTAYLCNLYDKALEMHRACYDCAVLSKDTVGMIYGLMDMATCQEMRHHLDSAEVLYNRAMRLALINNNKELEASIHTQISVMLLSQGKNDEALNNIRKSLEYDDPENRSATFSVARNIYDELGKEDSAFLYSMEALKSGTIYARQKSYGWLSAYYNKHKNPRLSLLYGNLYKKTTDSIFDHTATEAVARMNSLYNYQLREKENIRLEKENDTRQRLIIILSTVVIISVITLIYIVLYIREKHRKLSYKLQKYEQIFRSYEEKPQIEKEEVTNKIEKLDIIIRLRRKLNSHAEVVKLSEDDWNELSNAVNTMHTSFDEKLQDLCKMSEQDYRVCLLLKIGISPTDISKLIFKSKTGVSSIRRKLYERAFGKNGEAGEWDKIITSL